MALHTASGKVSAQSQSGLTTITADQTVTVASTTAGVTIGAAKHVLMTAGGAYLKLEGGNIELHGPGTIAFKASMKEFTGPKSASLQGPRLPKVVRNDRPVYSQQLDLSHLAFNNAVGFSSERMPYRVYDKTGAFVAAGRTDESGLTDRILSNEESDVVVLLGDGAWQIEEYVEDDEIDEQEADWGENV